MSQKNKWKKRKEQNAQEILGSLEQGQKKWQVKKERSKRASKEFENKEPAKDYGIKLAKGSKPGQIIIKKKNGEIEEERTYGSDPYPPKG